MITKIANIAKFGQQIWLDNFSRQLIKSGNLKKLISEDHIVGLTSNPVILYKALLSDSHYQEDLKQLHKSNLSLEERYENLVIPDIQAACDELLDVYKKSNHKAGYVSFELAPELANNSIKSIENAKRLWGIINRPNLMLKVPATPSGLTTLEELITLGINVNITLLFSIKQIERTWQAYINGLHKRLQQNLPLKDIRAVASLFLSRIDSAVDNNLPENLQGKIAIATAKHAYFLYLKLFNGASFSPLSENGAMAQDLLWASTGTKNSQYSDILYVENLIGENTINTLPEATLSAFRDHGKAINTLNTDISSAAKILAQANSYVNLEDLGQKLQNEGLVLFTKAFNDLIALMK